MTPNETSIRILVVDDEIQIQKLLSYGLSEAGWNVLCASSAEEGIRLVASENPSCLLLDLGLPKMSGMLALQEIRSFSSIPAIVLTVEDDDDLKLRAFEKGADDYVTKPFSMALLRARIQAVLRRSLSQIPGQVHSPSLFSMSHLRVDLSSHKVFVHNKEVHLTVTEFELLELFVQNAGNILTHKRILARIWGGQAGDQMHYLRVYINNLRRKIEENPSIPKLIVTEPGIGYRLEIT